MKKRISLVVSATAILLTLSMFAIFTNTIHAVEVDDGTYEIEYEMKEADNDNTSIADGYFTSPATLTVDDGEKRIRLTVTSAQMVKSLSVPTGDVEVVEEDKEEETRTVKFQVDQELSEPLPLEMHVVVPDLYDTTHTARAVFDADSVEAVSDDQKVSNIENNGNNETASNNDETAETTENENNSEGTDKNDENTEANANEAVSSANADAEAASQENDRSLAVLWGVLGLLGIVIIAGILFRVFHKQRNT